MMFLFIWMILRGSMLIFRGVCQTEMPRNQLPHHRGHDVELFHLFVEVDASFFGILQENLEGRHV